MDNRVIIDFFIVLSIFGVANQISAQLRPGGSTGASMRQTPPLRNGSGSLAPMSQAASSPRSGSCPTRAIDARRGWVASAVATSIGRWSGASASRTAMSGAESSSSARISAVW